MDNLNIIFVFVIKQQFSLESDSFLFIIHNLGVCMCVLEQHLTCIGYQWDSCKGK